MAENVPYLLASDKSQFQFVWNLNFHQFIIDCDLNVEFPLFFRLITGGVFSSGKENLKNKWAAL